MKTPDTVNHVVKIVTDLFNQYEGINSFCMIIKDDRESYVPIIFSNDFQKDVMSAGIKELVKRFDPDTVAYASEAWGITSSKREDIENVIPSQHKDRVEMVIIQIEFRTGEKFGCSAKIIRTEQGVKLGEFDISDSKFSMGRFVDFYPIAEKDKN
jgi:hypothetical protein